MNATSGRIRQAFRRTRFAIWTVALVYGISLVVGLCVAHAGNGFALNFRDRIVGQAVQESSILRQFQRGHSWAAAALDASGNAFAGLCSLVGGYAFPIGYGLAAYRGWVGGVVSVDGAHHSRLASWHEAFYYLTTLVLQLIPYSITAGAGVNLGLAAFTKRTVYQGSRIRWLQIPNDAIADAGRLYLVSLPLFAAASLFEFTM